MSCRLIEEAVRWRRRGAFLSSSLSSLRMGQAQRQGFRFCRRRRRAPRPPRGRGRGNSGTRMGYISTTLATGSGRYSTRCVTPGSSVPCDWQRTYLFSSVLACSTCHQTGWPCGSPQALASLGILHSRVLGFLWPRNQNVEVHQSDACFGVVATELRLQVVEVRASLLRGSEIVVFLTRSILP